MSDQTETRSISTIRPPESVLSTGQMLGTAPVITGVERASAFADRHAGGDMVANHLVDRQSRFLDGLRSIRTPGSASLPQLKFDLRRKFVEPRPADREVRRFTWPDSPT